MEGSVAKNPSKKISQLNDSDEYARQLQAYTDERKMLLDRGHEAHRDLDKWTLTLSSGALGLSITAMGAVEGAGWDYSHWSITLAWISFSMSVVAVVVSIWCSAKCYEKYRAKIDEAAIENFDSWQKIASEKQCKVKLGRFIDILNLFGLLCFVIGVVGLVYFANTVGSEKEIENVKVQRAGEGF